MGQQARRARKDKGLGLRELARAVRVSASFLCDLELGRRSWQGPKAREILAMVGIRKVAA